MGPNSPASLALEKLDIPHRLFLHAGDVTSLEQAARERGQQPRQVVRSILFRLAAGEYLLVLVAGPVQIPWKALRRYLGTSRVTMASEEEVLEVTGYRVGTVSPFGLPRPIRTLVDRSVFEPEEISMGAGIPNAGLILKSSDLRRALESVEFVDLLSGANPRA